MLFIITGIAWAADETTFIFLADPQINRNDGLSETNERLLGLSKLNMVLNDIEYELWPSGYSLTCENEPVGEVSAIFFGGDLTQTGGDINFWEQ